MPSVLPQPRPARPIPANGRRAPLRQRAAEPRRALLRPPRSRRLTLVCRLLTGVLAITLLGAGCTGVSPAGNTGGAGDAATTANLRPAAERQFQAFIDALDRGDATAARAMYSTRQVDPDLLLALTPAELHDFAAWLRTYQFGGVWGDRVEFRPTQRPPDQAVTSLYVHFASGTEGITY